MPPCMSKSVRLRCQSALRITSRDAHVSGHAPSLTASLDRTGLTLVLGNDLTPGGTIPASHLTQVDVHLTAWCSSQNMDITFR